MSLDLAGTTTLPGLRRADARALHDIWPMSVAVAPLGIAVGATVTTLDVPAAIGHASSPLLYSGSAQLTFLSLLDAGTGAFAILGTLVLANARLLIYSARLASSFQGQPRWFRWLAPTFLVDQTFSIVVARDDLSDPASFYGYWLTAGGVLGTAWVAMTGVGGVLGPLLRGVVPLEVAAPALFIGLLLPRLQDLRAVAVSALAGGIVLLGHASLGPLALPAALGAGLGAIIATDRRTQRTRRGVS